MDFGISIHLSDSQNFDEVEQKLRELLADQGFGILTEIDVKAVLKKKLDLDKRPYKILGACNPPRANQVMDADPELGIFLPCNVIIYEDSQGGINVSATNAATMFQMINNPQIEPIAKEVTDIFSSVMEQLEQHFS